MKFLVGDKGLGEKPNGVSGSRQEKSLSFRSGSRPFPSQPQKDTYPVHLVQVEGNECWEAAYGEADVRQNRRGQFKAKN